mgnify:CR=1 FL=1
MYFLLIIASFRSLIIFAFHAANAIFTYLKMLNPISVNSSQSKREFLKFPAVLYQNEKNYIRPLDKDIEEIFDPQKNKNFKKRNINMTFFMFHYVYHNFLIRCHFDEIFSESCSAGLYEHFDTKFEFFPCRITKIEFSGTTRCGPSRTCGTSGRIEF